MEPERIRDPAQKANRECENKNGRLAPPVQSKLKNRKSKT
jgi:hypothetical protein